MRQAAAGWTKTGILIAKVKIAGSKRKKDLGEARK
jgi:hypothetical protein